MHNKTLQVFETTASTYDRDRSRLIPGCDTFYGWAIRLLPSDAERIVDLGAGSGLLTVLVRNRFPSAHIWLLDFSQSMLDLARKRLEDDSTLTFCLGDYSAGPLPENVCAAVSSLSIHHLEDEAKQKTFARIYSALKPGGVFINAEQVAGPTPELDARYKSLWLEQVRALGATEQQIADLLYRQEQDRCVPVDAQLGWMRAAGFSDADCWYKEGRFAVMAGTKQ